MEDIRLQDISTATNAPASRISEALGGLGVAVGNRGRAPAVVNLSDAIRAGLVRGMIVLGLSSNASLDIARQISRESVREVIHRSETTWLGLRDDPERPGAYLFTFCTSDEMRDIAALGAAGLRFIDVSGVARAIIGEALKRKQLMPKAKGRGAAVSRYEAANSSIHGAVVESIDNATIGLAIVRYGKGTRIKLAPAEARLLGERLIEVAAQHEPAVPEAMN